MSNIQVTERDGHKAPLNLEKLYGVVNNLFAQHSQEEFSGKPTPNEIMKQHRFGNCKSIERTENE